MTKQQQILNQRTNEDLIKEWEMLETQETTIEIATVRGWYMDEIEKRWPEAFDRWLENCENNDNIKDYINGVA